MPRKKVERGNKIYTTMRLSPELHAALARAAKKMRTTKTAVMESALRSYLGISQ